MWHIVGQGGSVSASTCWHYSFLDNFPQCCYTCGVIVSGSFKRAWFIVGVWVLTIGVSAGCITQGAAATPNIEPNGPLLFQDSLPTPSPTKTPDIEATMEAGISATLAAILPSTPTPETTNTPAPTATPTLIPTPTATPRPTPTQTPLPVVDPQITRLSGTNRGDLMLLQVYLPEETLDRTVKRVVADFPIHGPIEYLVGFEHSRGPYYEGKVYVDPSLLQQRTRGWVQENVGISVLNLPQRVACTGSMRPVIQCGDLVRYEPVLPDTPLEIGDIITFRLSDQDVDISKNCPWISNSWGLTSVSSLIGTQRIYIIHRINRKVFGSFPERFLTLGDNNFFEDSCSVQKPSIVLRVVEIEKDAFVVDQDGYRRAVGEHQRLLEKYGDGLLELSDLLGRYGYILTDYNNRNRSVTSMETLEALYQSLITMETEINTLVDRLDALPAEIDTAEKAINLTVKPF